MHLLKKNGPSRDPKDLEKLFAQIAGAAELNQEGFPVDLNAEAETLNQWDLDRLEWYCNGVRYAKHLKIQERTQVPPPPPVAPEYAHRLADEEHPERTLLYMVWALSLLVALILGIWIQFQFEAAAVPLPIGGLHG